MLKYRHCDGRQYRKNLKFQGSFKARLTALFLCLSMLSGFLPAFAAADGEERLSEIVTFDADSITLHYAGADGQPETEAIQNNTLIEKNRELVLWYTYSLTEEQCDRIKTGTNYYLEVSPHLVLPDLRGGAPLTIEVSDKQKEQIGTLYADGSRAWVAFKENESGTGTVLSGFDGIEDAYFYLNCTRAGAPPKDEPPIDENGNLYAMKFESGGRLNFGYAENEPVEAKAQIQKNGAAAEKTITWTIQYTPWQNPSESDGITPKTAFELRDTIDAALHSYVEGSVKIDGVSVSDYTSRDDVPEDLEAYALIEVSENGRDTVLIFGGTKLDAGKATQGNPAKPLTITYQTSVNDDLLLPGGVSGRIANAAELFAGEDGVFNSRNIKSQSIVTVSQPVWLEKTGKTTRHTDGTGSTTEWTVTFNPNGFVFTEDSELTLHDQLPDGSILEASSVQVGGGQNVTVITDGKNGFTVSPVTAKDQPVVITYETHVPEDMYDSGTSLGSNVAWFTFRYDGKDYTTPQAKRDVGSGDGSGTPGTATLVKTNTGYDSATRTILWTVTINPHKAYLRGGTFTDDLKMDRTCGEDGHTGGLEMAKDVSDIDVKVNGNQPTADEQALIDLTYEDRVLTIEVGEIGAKTITITYATKVCDPCVFANNRSEMIFTNTVFTDDMIIGRQSATKRSARADSKATVGAAVLTKQKPVYDYNAGKMRWAIEVDEAGLPMTNVVLTDILPAGLTYAEDSLSTVPEIAGAAAQVQGQELTIHLGEVNTKTTVVFDTWVNPEKIGFGNDETIKVTNTVAMNGEADTVTFAEVRHKVEQSFSNHGLVKSSRADNVRELIEYEVLINPYHLALPENPALVDTLDRRLQLDTDTLRFYEAALSGTTGNSDQKPAYTKIGDGQSVKITGYDPATNSFTVQLPVSADSRKAYVLTYTADIIELQRGNYDNSVRFVGGSVLLGGSKNNSASVGGGGGGGGGGVAARKAGITVIKTDSENHAPLENVTFILYQWDNERNVRGLPFAQGTTDAQGKLSFKVKPGAAYELVETGSLPGYTGTFEWTELPEGVRETNDGLFITAGEARTELKLNLTNKAYTADIAFCLVNRFGIPMAGTEVRLFTSDPTGQTNPVPDAVAAVSADGTVRFAKVRRGATYYILPPDGGAITVTVPANTGEETKIKLPDGTEAILTAGYRAVGAMTKEQQWTLTITKTISGGTNPLSGARIGLYADSACQMLIQSAVSGPDGAITFDGLIRGQKYWLREIEAPLNYQPDSAVYEADETNSALILYSMPKPAEPGGPDTPDKPDIPDSPGDSDRPGGSDRPDGSDKPDGSDRPGAPGASGTPDDSDGFDAGDKQSGNHVTGNSSVLRTGDDTPQFAAIAIVSGALLAVMILYRFFGSKEREKK